MYHEKQLNNDLYHITQEYYVKFRLLKDLIEGKISESKFINELQTNKHKDDIASIMNLVNQIRYKIKANGGKVDFYPIFKSRCLRKEGRIKDAYYITFWYIQHNQNDIEGIVEYGWLLYHYMKEYEKDNNIIKYIKCLKLFNKYNQLDSYGVMVEDESYIKVIDSILWSIRRVINADNKNADIILPELLNFKGIKPNYTDGIFTVKTSAVRLLIQDISEKLNDSNYFLLMDTIGFNWLRNEDYISITDITDTGKKILYPSYAEKILNYHAKKIEKVGFNKVNDKDTYEFIEIINQEIKLRPNLISLRYNNAKLLRRVGNNDEALKMVTPYARMKQTEFWIWGFISTLVEKDRSFDFICKALVCKSEPKMIVKLQEQIIPLLVRRGMFANAKYEMDQLSKIYTTQQKTLPDHIKELYQESWYLDTITAKNRNELKKYAMEAEKILYLTLPNVDIFVTHINEEKNIVSFAYLSEDTSETKGGYFYKDSSKIKFSWELDKLVSVKMEKDNSRPELFKIFTAVASTNSVEGKFIKNEEGYVERNYGSEFAFVNDIYIHPKMVLEHNIQNNDMISYKKKRHFYKKKSRWDWKITDVFSVEKNDEDCGY